MSTQQNSGQWPRHIVINSEIAVRCDLSPIQRFILWTFCCLVSDSPDGTWTSPLSRIATLFEPVLSLKQLRAEINDLEKHGDLLISRAPGGSSTYQLGCYAVGVPSAVQWLGREPGPVFKDATGVPMV